MTTEIIATAALRLGDRITEIDTPDGPFYTVVRETAKSVWFDSAPDTDPCPIRIGKSPRSGVRRVVA